MVRFRRWCERCGRTTWHVQGPPIDPPWWLVLLWPFAWLVERRTDPLWCVRCLEREHDQADEE